MIHHWWLVHHYAVWHTTCQACAAQCQLPNTIILMPSQAGSMPLGSDTYQNRPPAVTVWQNTSNGSGGVRLVVSRKLRPCALQACLTPCTLLPLCVLRHQVPWLVPSPASNVLLLYYTASSEP